MANTKLSYNEPTNREDLSDVITNISPEQTPLTSMIGKTKASGAYHEFPEDELRDPAANAHVEGEADSVVAAPSRRRKGNHTQIMKAGYSVSGTQMAVSTAGTSNEYDLAMYKAMKEVARDLEYALVKNKVDSAGDSTTARTMAGVPGCITTNVLANKGTARKITRDLITDALQVAWAAGGEPNKLIVSGKNKRAISALTTSATKNIDAKKKTDVEAIDVIDTDFGRVEIVASRFMDDANIFVLDPQYLKVAYLRPFSKKELNADFDGKAGVITGEMTLEVRGEKGQAIITDLTV